MKFELFIKNIKENTENSIGSFNSMDEVDEFFKTIFEIVEINPEQFILIQKEYSTKEETENVEITRRNLIGVFATRADIEKFIQDTHVVKSI
jgi:hypothetical protein